MAWCSIVLYCIVLYCTALFLVWLFWIYNLFFGTGEFAITADHVNKWTETVSDKIGTNMPSPTPSSLPTGTPPDIPSFRQADLVDDHDRFLLYYSHSGFANQLVGIRNAAEFAYATNRTLVLSPILPHFTSKPALFKGWKGRAAGSKCGPYHGYQRFLKMVEDDVDRMMLYNHAFPSSMEIIDFEDITKKTGLKVVDTSLCFQSKECVAREVVQGSERYSKPTRSKM